MWMKRQMSNKEVRKAITAKQVKEYMMQLSEQDQNQLMLELLLSRGTVIPEQEMVVTAPIKAKKDLELVVTDWLKNLGIPAHILGYQYVRKAIMITVENGGRLPYITKQLYPEVAREYNTTPSRVERAIRHAIEVAWSRGNIGVIEDIFGYTIHERKGKTTNAEFIAMVADIICLQMK